MSRLQGGRSSLEQGTGTPKGCHTLHHRPSTEGDRSSREGPVEEPCKCHGERAAGSPGERSSGERHRAQGAVTEECVVLSGQECRARRESGPGDRVNWTVEGTDFKGPRISWRLFWSDRAGAQKSRWERGGPLHKPRRPTCLLPAPGLSSAFRFGWVVREVFKLP